MARGHQRAGMLSCNLLNKLDKTVVTQGATTMGNGQLLHVGNFLERGVTANGVPKHGLLHVIWELRVSRDQAVVPTDIVQPPSDEV